MKQICANCHFFIRQYYGHNGVEHSFEIGTPQRGQAQRGDLSWQKDSESLACFKGVWDEGCFTVGGSEKIAAISQRDRRGECYYFSYQPGMLLPTAENCSKSVDLSQKIA